MKAADAQYKYVRQKTQTPYALKYSLRKEERLDLIKECGLQGLVLFEYYLRLASVEDVEIKDDNAAEYFGWNVHTARRYRRQLVKFGWLHKERAKLKNSHTITLYYLGKREVLEAKGSKAG